MIKHEFMIRMEISFCIKPCKNLSYCLSLARNGRKIFI